ncbi:hypothetical protein E2C01_035611 [Portunus trituberculatus]|uniref:Uncharacterized protein n=1 Tax=Portunus trituberculatus TaxID=210409 RepID=A0A5B7F9T8_PORTR|nr:hypothetical protein [Portunus trituberculatus]
MAEHPPEDPERRSTGPIPDEQTNRDVELKARMIVAIEFVPLANVENKFESLQDTTLNKLEPIFNYFEDTYVGRPRHRNGRCNPMFPYSM